MRKTELFAIAVILLSFVIGAYFYSSMPDRMTSHWNAAGEVDGHMPKFWGLFLMPIISAGLFLLYAIIPSIDPRKENIEKFRKYYDGFITLMMLFLLYIYLLSIWWNLGARFDFVMMMVPAFAALLYYVGILLENARQNWFIGIRTPWTLSSEKVWDKTHRIGGKLFKVAAIIALFGIEAPNYAIWLIVAPAIFIAIYTVIYSYLEYRKE